MVLLSAILGSSATLKIFFPHPLFLITSPPFRSPILPFDSMVAMGCLKDVIGVLDRETLLRLTVAVREVSPAEEGVPDSPLGSSSCHSRGSLESEEVAHIKTQTTERSQRDNAMHELRDAGIHISGSSLRSAASRGQVEACNLLVLAGVNVDEVDVSGRTALALSCRAGQLGTCRALLSCGADISFADNEGCTPLDYAAHVGHTHVVRHLLECSSRNMSWGETLLIAVREGHTEISRMLCAKGVRANVADESGWTALMYAAWNGDLQVCVMLLDRAAKVNAVTPHGETSLMLAVRAGHKKVVSLLCERGANVRACTKAGLSVMDIARRNQRQSAMLLLAKHGAEQDSDIEEPSMMRPALFH